MFLQINTGVTGNTFFHNIVVDAPTRNNATIIDIDGINQIISKEQTGKDKEGKKYLLSVEEAISTSIMSLSLPRFNKSKVSSFFI